MMEKPVIYALVDPRTNSIRYIGKTINLKARLYAHRNWKSLNCSIRKHRWTFELARAGLSPTVQALEEMAEHWMIGSTLNDAEKRWIAHGRALGWDLLNVTGGG
jgi:predicted GIY-YIG superfamily endonuclease